ncbi:STAS domain-containing protein [Streptomyces tauricus]|uniref:STAS domain-containing protein n=1 Tax=Streptomyces tauricus TaxID=68274 RepID=UPI0033A57010
MGGVPGSLVGGVFVVSGRIPVPLTSLSRHNFRTIVRLRGELTLTSAPRMRKKLLRALARSPGVLEADLGKVTYLAPAASAVLLAAAATARRSGTGFVITHASPRSLHMLRELGMQRLVDAPLLPDPYSCHEM